MTDKKLKNYGVEVTEKANIAMSLLKQKGIVFPEDMEKELNVNWSLYFRAGYAAALEDQKISKARAADRKNKKFLIADFIDKYIGYGKDFLKGVYYDKENNALVTTNGNFLVYTACDNIPVEYENKIVNKDGVIIEARFPNWQKVIPDNKDIEIIPDNDKFISDVINTNINFNMTMAAANKDRRAYKIGEFVFGAKMIKFMDLFLKTQKNVIVKMYKEDGYRPKIENAVVLKGDSATMVVMPYIASNFNVEDIIYIGEAAA